MRDMMMMMMMIRRDVMIIFVGEKSLTVFNTKIIIDIKSTRDIGGKLALVENGQQVHAARPHRRRAGRRGRRRRARATGRTRRSRIKYACL